jgi:pimeloyl-ACP methyl ester carboxylesterase
MSQPPVILLHGWGGSFNATFGKSGWVAALLGLGRKVIAIDLPGHGSAPASIDPSDYADLAGQVMSVLRAQDGPVDVVAYSLGAKVAIEMACRRPDAFSTLVLGGVGDNAFAVERDASGVAKALEGGLLGDEPSSVQTLVSYSRISGGDPRTLAAVLRRPANPTANAARMSAIKARILVVNGDHDALARPDAALVGALPRADHLVLSGVDHFGLTADERFRQAALDFLNAGEDRRTPQQAERAAAR